MMVDASEKLYSDYQLITTNPGGHSSLPKPDNAVYRLADALARLEHYQFPFELTTVTRAYYERMATIATGERAADIRAILKTPPDMNAVSRFLKEQSTIPSCALPALAYTLWTPRRGRQSHCADRPM